VPVKSARNSKLANLALQLVNKFYYPANYFLIKYQIVIALLCLEVLSSKTVENFFTEPFF
jgi:hypothetical protein